MSSKRNIIMGYLALVLLLIPMWIMGLWIYAAEQGNTQAERVAIFHEYLPTLLRGYNVTSLISVTCCFLAIVLSDVSFSRGSGAGRIVNIVVMIIGSLLFLLNLFGMM